VKRTGCKSSQRVTRSFNQVQHMQCGVCEGDNGCAGLVTLNVEVDPADANQTEAIAASALEWFASRGEWLLPDAAVSEPVPVWQDAECQMYQV
jgi:hypothetical protein